MAVLVLRLVAVVPVRFRFALQHPLQQSTPGVARTTTTTTAAAAVNLTVTVTIEIDW
jgi:hypothetical protein